MTMIRECFRTVSLLGLTLLASVPTAGCASRELPVVSLLPRVDEVRPLGVRRGFAVELSLHGSALAGYPRLVAPFKFAVAPLKRGDWEFDRFKVRITVDPSTPLGIYPVRVLTDEGLSDPFPLAVGQLPQIQEKEDNGYIGGFKESKWNAQRIVVPTVVEGALRNGGDYDWFRFRGEARQRVFAKIQGAGIGSGIDVDLDLLSLDRKFTHLDRPAGEMASPPLFATLPANDDFLFGVYHTTYRMIKGGRPVYRLTIGALPAAAEVYPLGGRRGETIRVELRGGTLDDVMVVPAFLMPESGESVVRLKAPTALRGPDGSPLDVEGLPPLIVGDLPEVLEPAESDAPPPKATPPVVFNGRIDRSIWIDEYRVPGAPPDDPGDEDRFTLAVTPGRRFRVLAAARALGSALVPTLRVSDARGKELSTTPLFAPFVPRERYGAGGFVVPTRGGLPEHVTSDPAVEFTVPDGQTEVTLTVGGHWTDRVREGVERLFSLGGHAYRVTVLPVTPGFSIALNDAQVSVPRGGTAAVGVTVTRDGYNGPITLRVADPPPGLSCRPGIIAEGQALGALTLAATSDATFGPLVLDVIGEGHGSSGPIIVQANKVVLFGPPAIEPMKAEVDSNVYMEFPARLRLNFPTQPGLLAIAVKAAPLRFDAPAGPIEVTRGSATTFKVEVNRPQGASGSLSLRPLPLPPGLSIPEIELGATATEATVKVLVTGEHPPGAVTIVLTAEGKIAGAIRQFAVPAVTLNVVGPAAVDSHCPVWDTDF